MVSRLGLGPNDHALLITGGFVRSVDLECDPHVASAVNGSFAKPRCGNAFWNWMSTMGWSMHREASHSFVV